MNKKKYNKTKEPITIDYENKRLPVYYFLPLLLIAGFVPLIVYAKYIDLTGTTQALYWTGQQQYLDFFSYWKSRWVIVLTAIALITYIILYKQKKLPFKKSKQYYIPLGIYAVFVIISTIFASDTPTALWGFVDMYQGMFVLLSYMLITFLTINFVNNERDVSLFVKVFLFLMIIEGIIGVGQYFGVDFFQTKIGKDLILPNNLKVEDLSFSFGPKTIYGTLFNTNFVGSFATLMIPLSIAIFLGSKSKKHRIIAGISVLLMIFVLIGCNSRAGYLGMAVAGSVAIVQYRKYVFKHWKVTGSISALLIILLIGLNIVSNGMVIDRVKSFNILKQLENIKNQNETTTKIENIILEENIVTIKTNKEILSIKIDENKVYFFDEENNELEIKQNKNNIKIEDERYINYKITIPANYPGVSVSVNWHVIDFYIKEDGIKILGSGGRLTEPIVSERLEMLDGYESFASNRGYIWGRSIPLLKNYIIYGSGADNFPIAFPQDDFIGKMNAYWDWDANLVVDKPHSMYLQIAINTGVISLLALLIAVGYYIISSLKLYSKITFDTMDNYLGASCLISVIGYLAAGVFNDQVIAVAPIFYLILGMGISINLRLSKSNHKLE
ncbi:MAG: O-antigen ligase family protein [Sedimentibacter sp.]